MNQLSTVLVQGILTTRSPLSIGSGLSYRDQQVLLGANARKVCFRDGDEKLNATMLVQRDVHGLPFVPGSVVKNAVRRALTRLAHKKYCTQDDVDRILGSEPDDAHCGGCVMFYAAMLDDEWLRKRHVAHPEAALFDGPHRPAWWDESQLSYVDVSVAINRRTGSAARHFLAFREVLPPGLPFRFSARIDHPDNDLTDTKLLLLAMEALNANWNHSPVSIGAETSNGWGLLNWKTDKDSHGHVPSVFRRGYRFDGSALQPFAETVAVDRPVWPVVATPVRRLICSLKLKLIFDGPFLVIDPAWKSPAGEPDYRPQMTSNGGALLPASSFRGVFRSALERIIHTMNDGMSADPMNMDAWTPIPLDLQDILAYRDPDTEDDFEAESDSAIDDESLADFTFDDEPLPDSESPPANMLHQLLGSTSHRSGLYCTDFTGLPDDTETRLRKLEMVAIDRLAGGASSGAKFTFTVFERPTLNGSVRVEIEDSKAGLAAMGVIAMGLRDLCEGDLSFGCGIYKGFGSCIGKIEECEVTGLSNSWLQTELARTIRDQTLEDDTVNKQVQEYLSDPDNQASAAFLNHLLDKALFTVREFLKPHPQPTAG